MKIKKILVFLFIIFLGVCEETPSINVENNLTNKEKKPNENDKEIKPDVFEKEIEILENTINLYRKKIEILKKIRQSYVDNKKTIMVILLFDSNKTIYYQQYPDIDKLELEKLDFSNVGSHKGGNSFIDSTKKLNEMQPIQFMNKLFLRFSQKVETISEKRLIFIFRLMQQ